MVRRCHANESKCSPTLKLHKPYFTCRSPSIPREYNRLLYVALTRAEDRLLVCGWHIKRGVPDDSWYRMAERGFRGIGAEARPFDVVPGTWDGQRMLLSSPQTAHVVPLSAAAPRAPEPLPPWAGRPGNWRPESPPPEPPLPTPLAPSRPDGAALGPVPRAASPLQARDDAGQRFLRDQLAFALSAPTALLRPLLAQAPRAYLTEEARLRDIARHLLGAGAAHAEGLAPTRHFAGKSGPLNQPLPGGLDLHTFDAESRALMEALSAA